MSAKTDAKNMNSSVTPEKTDWEQDDDDTWEDWGDAEDNFDESNKPDLLDATPKHNKSRSTNNNILINSTNTVKSNETKRQDINCNSEKSTRAVNQPAENPATTPKQTAGWGGLFGGVVSSVFSSATEGLGNITSTMSQGLNQVIGAPDPEELARLHAAEAVKAQSASEKTIEAEQKSGETDMQNQQVATNVFGLNIVSGVTSLGTKVLNTGLDTLEGIGKKTMNILQENDPLLMNKRKLLGLESDRPNLSEVLKEAKKDADQLENTLKEMKLEKSREMLRFDLLFENHCGLVHLEALEILSKESTLKMQKLQDAISGNALRELQETITEVKELMEMEDLEGESDGNYDAKELNARLLGAIEDADLQINFDDIMKNWENTLDWLQNIPSAATNDIVQDTFAQSITTLAEACALEMNKLHKIAELLLVKEHHSTANEVDCIVQLCKQFNTHLNGLTNRFATALTDIKVDPQIVTEEDAVKTCVSTLFAEMLCAIQQVEKAFNLFLPILQIGAV